MASFRFQGSSVFLTYSQIGDVELSSIVKHLHSLFPVKDVTIREHTACIEKHKDGGRHCHVYLGFSGRLRKNVPPSFFDFDKLHPNIAVPRSRVKVIRYIMLELRPL